MLNASRLPDEDEQRVLSETVTRQPLKHLIGEKLSHRKKITIEELEEKIEAR
jgi:hypothetical protein